MALGVARVDQRCTRAMKRIGFELSTMEIYSVWANYVEINVSMLERFHGPKLLYHLVIVKLFGWLQEYVLGVEKKNIMMRTVTGACDLPFLVSWPIAFGWDIIFF